MELRRPGRVGEDEQRAGAALVSHQELAGILDEFRGVFLADDQLVDVADGAQEAVEKQDLLICPLTFGDIAQEQYLENARALLNAVPGEDLLEKTRSNGDILHYRISTGEFAVMTAQGRIRTYFKADYKYWMKQ